MNRVPEFALRAYLGGLTAAPVIGANYYVWANYVPENTVWEFATDAVSGAFCGAVIGILSPVIAIGLPTYLGLKLANKKNVSDIHRF
jgi:uncharacterized membrane protein